MTTNKLSSTIMRLMINSVLLIVGVLAAHVVSKFFKGAQSFSRDTQCSRGRAAAAAPGAAKFSWVFMLDK